jgi:RNA polymerase sigma-70 factor, ECF subfamily
MNVAVVIAALPGRCVMAAVREFRALTDIELVGEVLAGRTDLFSILVERNQSKVYAVAYGILREPQAATEVAQEAFIVAFRRLEGFRGESQLWSWLYTITRRLALHEAKRATRRPELTLDEPSIREDSGSATRLDLVVSKEEEADEFVARRELREQLAEAMEELPNKHREILVLRHFEDLSYKEISERLAIPEGTVMSRLFHARKKMAIALSQRA